jgi:hypothetical protein
MNIKGKDLIHDFHGKTPVKWALKVVEHLFTSKELAENTLTVNKNNRLK